MRKRSRTDRVFLLLCAAFVLACTLGIVSLFYLTRLQDVVVKQVERALKRPVTLEKARLGLQRGRLGVRLYDLRVGGNGTEGGEIFSTKYLFVGLDLLPLLRGKVRIQRLTGFHPRIRIGRDPSGALNVADLFAAAYLKSHYQKEIREAPLSRTLAPLLWKDEVDFRNAEIVLEEGVLDEGGRIRLSGIDLVLVNRLHEDRLTVELDGQIREPVAAGAFSLRGEIRGWKEARSPSELLVHLDLQFRDVTLEEVACHLPAIVQGKQLEGRLKGRIQYEGAPTLPGTARVEFDLEDWVWKAPGLYPWKHAEDRVTLRAALELGREEVRVKGGELHLGSLGVRCEGGLRMGPQGISFIDFTLGGDDLDLVAAKSYIPLARMKGKVWPFVVGMIRKGRVDARARLRGTPEDFSRMGTAEGEDALRLRIRFRDTEVLFPVEEPYLPFERISGFLELGEGTLFFKDFQAEYGRIVLQNAEGAIRNIHKSKSQLRIKGVAELDMEEAFRELDHGIIPDGVREIARGLHNTQGEGMLDIELAYNFGREVDEDVQVSGTAWLEGVETRYGTWNLPMREITGGISFTNGTVSVRDAKVVMGESPVCVNGQIWFGGAGKGADGEILLSSEALQAQDVMAFLGDGEGVEGLLGAEGVLHWKGGRMTWEARGHGEALSWTIDPYRFPIESFRGEFEGDEGNVALRELDFRVQGSRFTGDGRWRLADPDVVHLRLACDSLDLARFFSERKPLPRWRRILMHAPEAFQSGGHSMNAALELNCDRISAGALHARGAFLQGRIGADGIAVQKLRARVGEGRLTLEGEGKQDNDAFPFSIWFSLEGVPAQDLMGWFDVPSRFILGTLSLEGKLEGRYASSETWKRTLKGTASLQCTDGTIHRYEVLSKILTLVNFTQWSRVRMTDLATRGVPFERIAGNLRVRDGRVETDSVVIDSSVARAEFLGAYDFVEDRMDLQLSVRPLEQLDQMIDRLPVVGRVISGPDGTIVIFYYRLTGPLKEPQVTLIPFKSLNDRLNGKPFQGVDDWLRSIGERLAGG